MPDTVLQLGIGGVFALLLIDRFIAMVRARNNKTKSAEEVILRNQMQDLWEWHRKEDEEGVKIWYVRRSLETAINKLTKTLDVQTRALEQVCRDTATTREAVVVIRDRGQGEGRSN